MDYVKVGKISQTHALKGELKIKSDSGFKDERFKVGASLFVIENNEYKELKVKSYRTMKDYDLLSFEGYNSIDDVMFMVHKDLYAKYDRSLLEDGEYFYSDLVDLEVYQGEKKVGIVKSLSELPQCKYLIIEKLNKKEVMIPFLREFILDIDLKEKRIDVVEMEGLI